MRRRRPAPSTRARVLGWILFIVTVALALNLIAVAELLHGRARADVEAELGHEALKFRTFAGQAVDPATGSTYAGAAELLRAYLAEVVPDEQEAMFSVVDGRARHRTRNEVPARLDLMPQVVSTAGSARAPLTSSVQTPSGEGVTR